MTYLFIDGGHLRAGFKKCMSRYHDGDVDLSIQATTHALRKLSVNIANPQKIFYYDCVDELQGGNESDEDLARRVKAQEDRFNAIRDSPGWHVREGRLVGERKPRQKRVDVLLAVEMLSHAFNKNMQEAILIAGDDDFTPLVEELLRHGTFVQVWSDRRSGSPHLRHTADFGRSIGYRFYWHLTHHAFQEKHPLPDNSIIGKKDGGRLVEYGRCKGGEKVTILESEGLFHFCILHEGYPVSRVRAREIRVLHAYLEDELADLLPEKWEQSNPAAHAPE